jgi:CRP-like cAMP-binding protein
MATHVAWIARDFGRRDMSPLSNADVDALGRVLEPIRVEAGRRILSPGDPADAAYIVEEGEVELAVLLGASRQSVNRALRELSKDGLVRQRYGEIEILDADRILELAGEGAFLRGVC